VVELLVLVLFQKLLNNLIKYYELIEFEAKKATNYS